MEWESFSAPGGGEGPRAFALHPPGELVSDLLRRDRTWEGVESALLRAALRPGSVVVDAGANLGWHALAKEQLRPFLSLTTVPIDKTWVVLFPSKS